GIDLSFRFMPGAAGLGLGLEAAPGYGLARERDMLDDLAAGRALELAPADSGARAAASLSYGLAVSGGVLTPYGRAGERRSWLLGYAADGQELKIEYRLGE
ncbi:MAG: hypothetical protein ISN26_00920, partial [Betaproteobacteria bacterium AqS2]|nr:hypothetical protein [Betaproteobacteria bacterium AqS2]